MGWKWRHLAISRHPPGAPLRDPQSRVSRWVANVAALPPAVRRRLVLENDERLFTADDVLAASRRSGIPVVFDWLHHAANPGARLGDERALLDECFATWGPGDGVPKTHFSSQAPDRKR